MKTKNIIFGALSGLFSLLIIVPLCITNWVYYRNDVVAEDGAGMFADWSAMAKIWEAADKSYLTFFLVLIQIFAIAALVAGVVYLLLYILDMAKVTKPEKTSALKKFLSWIMIISGIIVLISGLVFMFGTISESSILGVTIKAGYKGAAGFYLAFIFPILAGVAGILGAGKAKKSKK